MKMHYYFQNVLIDDKVRITTIQNKQSFIGTISGFGYHQNDNNTEYYLNCDDGKLRIFNEYDIILTKL